MDIESSPERPLVKKTYLDRSKQAKRKKPEDAEESEEYSDNEFVKPSKKARTPSPIEVPFSGPITKSTLKKVASGAKLVRGISRGDLDLPGPEPRRTPYSKNAASTPSSSKKKSHARSSSLSSAGGPQQATPSKSIPTPVSARKPPSVASSRSIKPPSTNRRAGTPETEMDDGTSIAESAVSVRGKRRTEAERIQYFRDQPLCGDFEPHEAQCKKCGRNVKLGKASYASRPWEIHRARCDIVKAHGAGDEPPAGGFKLRLTAAERKAFLEQDPNCTGIQSDQVSCRRCKKIIKLSIRDAYKLNNWLGHSASCGASEVPSTRVEAATRKVKLVNDPQAGTFNTNHVVCAYCQANVDLTGAGDYSLEKWEEHKKSCLDPDRPPIEEAESGVPSDISSIPFPSPPSITSTTTETTLVPPERSHASPLVEAKADGQQGKKRPRGEVDCPEATDLEAIHPSNRPRKSSDAATEEESPGMLGWMMLPFHAFVRGFRESLSRG